MKCLCLVTGVDFLTLVKSGCYYLAFVLLLLLRPTKRKQVREPSKTPIKSQIPKDNTKSKRNGANSQALSTIPAKIGKESGLQSPKKATNVRTTKSKVVKPLLRRKPKPLEVKDEVNDNVEEVRIPSIDMTLCYI